jgi:glycosyltransferase involved in cell wall biosynthesis
MDFARCYHFGIPSKYFPLYQHLSLNTPVSTNKTAKTQVCHLIDSLEVGGMEQMLCQLAIEQKRNGWDVFVGCLFRSGPLEARLSAAGIPVVSFAKQSGFDLRVVQKIRAWLKQYPVAYIHTHNAVTHYYTASALVGLPRKVNMNTRHDMGLHNKSARLSAFYRISMFKTNRVAAVCEAAKNKFITSNELPAAKCIVIPNGINVQAFSANEPLAFDVRTLLNLDKNCFVIGTVGRLNEVKAQDVLIKAIAELRSRHLDAHLILVGNGPEKAKLQTLVEELKVTALVHFLGERSDVAHFLWSFDIFALTSKTEGYSMALVEASAASLPIVASDVGGNHEIVQANQSGILYPEQSTKQLVDALELLFKDPSKRLNFSQHAGAWAQEFGGLGPMYERYAHEYRNSH